MNYTIRVLLFFLLLIVQILLDGTINKCKNKYGKILLLLHHFIGVYIYIGSLLLGYHLFHLIIVIIAIIAFSIKNTCPMTKWQNDLCNFNEKFNSYINIIFGNKHAKKIHLLLLVIIIIYDLYYINKQYKFIK